MLLNSDMIDWIKERLWLGFIPLCIWGWYSSFKIQPLDTLGISTILFFLIGGSLAFSEKYTTNWHFKFMGKYFFILSAICLGSAIYLKYIY